jgi:hypothetical protein
MKKHIISNVQYKILELFKEFLSSEPNADSLEKFVKQLKNFYFSIEDIDKTISQEIFSCWGYMEIVYANLLDNPEVKLRQADCIVIRESYQNLLSYSEILLNKYCSEPTDFYE